VEDGEDLPYLRPALRRLLEQFPAAEDGLLPAAGVPGGGWPAGESSFGGIFRAITRLEEPNQAAGTGGRRAPFHSPGAGRGAAPSLTQTGDHFELTELGRALLAGEADWSRATRGIACSAGRGGVHLEGKKVWRGSGRGGGAAWYTSFGEGEPI